MSSEVIGGGGSDILRIQRDIMYLHSTTQKLLVLRLAECSILSEHSSLREEKRERHTHIHTQR